jgi:hypothetical protein
MPDIADEGVIEPADLAKARFEYCLKLYEREQDRRKTLESKAQFHLTLITAFLGALLLRLDALKELGTILQQNAPPRLLVAMLFTCAGLFSIALLASLLGVLMTIKAQSYPPEYVSNPDTRLFDPADGYIKPYTETVFFRETAMTYMLATLDDRKVNDTKAGSLLFTSYSLLVTILAFAIMFGIVAYIQLV